MAKKFVKFGPDHQYSNRELELFARYRDTRAEYRPTQCMPDAEHCWVEKGPRGWSSRSGKHPDGCIACQGMPRYRPASTLHYLDHLKRL